MANEHDEDFIPDYGLPPRAPSPSLLESNVTYSASFLSPFNPNVPAFVDKKKKKKGDPVEEFYIDDDDEEIVEIKQEIKEEPVTLVNLSEEEGEEGDIQVVDITVEDPKARRERWRNKQRKNLRNKSNAPNPPLQGTSGRFANANGPVPVQRTNSLLQDEVIRSPSTSSLASAAGSEGQQSGVNVHPNSAATARPASAASTTTSQASTVEVLEIPQPQQIPEVNLPQPPQPSVINPPRSQTDQPFSHTTINVNIESGKSVLVNVPGQPQFKITAIPAEPINLPPPPPPTRVRPPAPPPPNLRDSDCQTGRSVLNGTPIIRRNIDLTQRRSDSPSNVLTTGSLPPTAITADKAAAAASAVPRTKPRTTNNSNQDSDSTFIENAAAAARRQRSPSPDNHSRRRHRKRRSRSSSSGSSSRSWSSSPSITSPRKKQKHRSTKEHTSRVESTSPKLFKNGRELIELIKNCSICKDKFKTRTEGVAHQKKIHSKKFCPVCFKLLPRSRNSWKNHITSRHRIKNDNDVDEAKCPLCKKPCEYEGLYQHIGKKHLMKIEHPNRRPLPPAPIIPPSPSTRPQRTATITRSPPPANDSEDDSEDDIPVTARVTGNSSSNEIPTSSASSSSKNKNSEECQPSTPTNSKSATRFTIPKIVATHGSNTQTPAKTSQQHSRDVGKGGDSSGSEDSAMDEVVGAIHTAYLNNVYNNLNGIPDNLQIEAISNKLGVVSRSITTWFVKKHQQQKQAQKRSVQSIFRKKK